MKKGFILSTIMAVMSFGSIHGQTTETRTNSQTRRTQTETVTISETTNQNGTTVYSYTHSHTHSSDIPAIGGLKVSANMYGLSTKWLDEIGNNMKGGISAGFFLKFDITKYIALQYDLLFHYKTTEIEFTRTGTTSDCKYMGFEMPLYAIGQINMGNGKAFVGVGPYVGLGLSLKGQSGDMNLYKKNELTDFPSMNRWDFGGGVICGYEFNKLLTISASYQHGFLNMVKNGNDIAIKNQTLSIGVGIRF